MKKESTREEKKYMETNEKRKTRAWREESESQKNKKKMRRKRIRNEITAREKSRTQCPPSFLNVHYLCILAETPVANPFLCHIR